MALIPAGEFQMGSNDNTDEKPKKPDNFLESPNL
jgi:formylglycine-generating enzyme required for sulfatase activity